MRQQDTRLIGSVAYRPEQYGPRIIRLALDIVQGKFIEPTVFTEHELITPENVDQVYPNDYVAQIVTSRT